ncbi:hypothetical protein EVAR_10998_1 [Eumeta japonica]|uniref:Uncharacterized protein n=1 Tax=Eumeta variegata TaxID=151549 RepID=A0A4C1YI83_EUMVA|nr:hypothetical protein EVAR_10998_1 [Eumeta japonica]
MKQRSLAVFGLVDILVEYTLAMIGFQGLITELEVWKLHHQTLKKQRLPSRGCPFESPHSVTPRVCRIARTSRLVTAQNS